MAWMVVRVRGTIHARHDIVETLQFLHLTRPNHATVLPEAASFQGMLTKVQGYVTWGEAEPETVGLLLQERVDRPRPRSRSTPARVKSATKASPSRESAPAASRTGTKASSSPTF